MAEEESMDNQFGDLPLFAEEFTHQHMNRLGLNPQVSRFLRLLLLLGTSALMLCAYMHVVRVGPCLFLGSCTSDLQRQHALALSRFGAYRFEPQVP